MIDMICPRCKSSNVIRKYYVPISKYGHLPLPPVDFCVDCEFKSRESFVSINYREIRNSKLNIILQNGI